MGNICQGKRTLARLSNSTAEMDDLILKGDQSEFEREVMTCS